jgi:hypothetical protein
MSQILIRIGHLTFIVTIVIYVNHYDRYQNGRKAARRLAPVEGPTSDRAAGAFHWRRMRRGSRQHFLCIEFLFGVVWRQQLRNLGSVYSADRLKGAYEKAEIGIVATPD